MKVHENDDLWYALEYHPTEGLTEETIEDIVAEVPGHNDEDDWWWVLKIKDKGFCLFSGGCDYTGWDCQSGVEMHGYFSTATEAANAAPKKEEYTERNIKQELVNQLEGKTPFGTEWKKV